MWATHDSLTEWSAWRWDAPPAVLRGLERNRRTQSAPADSRWLAQEGIQHGIDEAPTRAHPLPRRVLGPDFAPFFRACVCAAASALFMHMFASPCISVITSRCIGTEPWYQPSSAGRRIGYSALDTWSTAALRAQPPPRARPQRERMEGTSVSLGGALRSTGPGDGQQAAR